MFSTGITTIVFYVIMVCFLIGFLSVLLAGRRKSKYRIGRKKRIAAILKQDQEVVSNQYNCYDAESTILKLEHEFTKHGEVDYETMIDVLSKIKISGNEIMVQTIIDEIKNNHPYYHVSKSSELLFENIESEIMHGNYRKAIEELKIVYHKEAEIEKRIKGLGVVGVIASLISLLIPIIEYVMALIKTWK